MSASSSRETPVRKVLTISSGLGPIEARRFVARLAHELECALLLEGARIVDRRLSGGAGGASVTSPPRSVDLVFVGADAQRWVGTHALVERSDRRARRSRKRWFVGVTLRTEGEADLAARGARSARVSPAEVEIRFCRSRGPGGQHVNRTESAVRARHLPSGVVVRAEEERSRGQNLALAMRRIEALLDAQASARVADARDERRSACLAVERGRPVATWRLADGRLSREPA